MVVRQTPYVYSFSGTNVIDIKSSLDMVLGQIRSDGENGADSFQYDEITLIANIDVADFDGSQIRFYKDTTTSKYFLATFIDGAVKKVELT